jgi:hypothetical protein
MGSGVWGEILDLKDHAVSQILGIVSIARDKLHITRERGSGSPLSRVRFFIRASDWLALRGDIMMPWGTDDLHV